MRIHHNLESAADAASLHLAVGIFDGVHLGHQAVVESALKQARSHRGRAGVLTFTPHPSRLFRSEAPTLLIQPPAIKERVLANMGLDDLVWMPFDSEFAALPAAQFVPLLKRSIPGLRSLHVGENFRYGQGRSGDVELMVRTARPLDVHVVSIQRLRFDGETISSTRIREKLREGDIPAVNNMLGYAYCSTGVVTPGHKLGRLLGFPTLNLPWQPECQPAHGVYAVTVCTDDSPPLPGVANYGLRPTVEDTTVPLLEVHLLGDTTLGPGAELCVEWHARIREERRFASLDALKDQIAKDRETAREILKR